MKRSRSTSKASKKEEEELPLTIGFVSLKKGAGTDSFIGGGRADVKFLQTTISDYDAGHAYGPQTVATWFLENNDWFKEYRLRMKCCHCGKKTRAVETVCSPVDSFIVVSAPLCREGKCLAKSWEDGMTDVDFRYLAAWHLVSAFSDKAKKK